MSCCTVSATAGAPRVHWLITQVERQEIAFDTRGAQRINHRQRELGDKSSKRLRACLPNAQEVRLGPEAEVAAAIARRLLRPLQRKSLSSTLTSELSQEHLRSR